MTGIAAFIMVLILFLALCAAECVLASHKARLRKETGREIMRITASVRRGKHRDSAAAFEQNNRRLRATTGNRRGTVGTNPRQAASKDWEMQDGLPSLAVGGGGGQSLQTDHSVCDYGLLERGRIILRAGSSALSESLSCEDTAASANVSGGASPGDESSR